MARIKVSTIRSTIGLGTQLLAPASRIPSRTAVSLNSNSAQQSPTNIQTQVQQRICNPKVISTPVQPNQNQFNALIHSLTLSLTTTASPDLPHLTRLLRSYNPSPSSSTISSDLCMQWQRYAHANPAKQYTRNLVSEVPGLFQLLMLVWTPGMRSPVHDHAGADCLMKVLKGTLRERRWSLPPKDNGLEVGGKGMVQTSDVRFGMGKVAYMSDALGVHEVGNPSDSEYAVSLHLYTPPSAATQGCNIYDVDKGVARHVMQGAYDSAGGVVGA